MAITRIFRSGKGLAVRLPKGFAFEVGEIEILRLGDDVILRKKVRGLGRIFDIASQFPEDVVRAIGSDGPPQKRKGL
ncbi:MAG: AbrB/MazE/SpoVT family DNA-binding domain-containing protein [Alphaproteobacteria bacterium]|nr:AbrB/MazE/SpoVT family DNA-binding domain-containing protein [Alphaproteobacteria bacterium]